MPVLHISVHNKIATYRQRDGGIVCGNSDYEIAFSFDEEWDGYPNKVARFIWNGEFQDVGIEGDTCAVPVIQNASEVKVGVFAEELSTTTPATIACQGSILCVTATPSVENDGYWANEARQSAETATEAATRSEDAADRAVAAVGFEASDFYNHESNRENPHGVTPEQIGAVPVGRTVNGKPLSDNVTLGASDVGAVPVERTVNGKPLSSNVSLTASDVGAASSGYGYGDMPKKILDTAGDATGSLLESALKNELAKMSNSTVKQILFYAYPNIPGGYCIGTFHRHDADNAVLTGVNYNPFAGSFVKRKHNGAWTPLEWVNPPMEVGKEYRTTERFLGQPVYTMLRKIGGFTGNATCTFGESGYHAVVRIFATASYGGIRLKVDDSKIKTIQHSAGYVYVQVSMGSETCTECYVQMWYTK